jgi:hypothetical protein
MKFVALDLETTSTETDSAEVVQAAVVAVEGDIDDSGRVRLAWDTERVQKIMCFVKHIPPGATEVHGITAADVADAKPFSVYAGGLVKSLTSPDTVVVTFNGAGYDLVIIERYLGFPLALDHVDMYRAWMHDRNANTRTPWDVRSSPTVQRSPITAGVFSGSLGGAHAFYTGESFSGAHDAAIDCRATLRVFAELQRSVQLGLERPLDVLRRWTKEPLPGCVDFSGKLNWSGDRACISFGKHRGTPIESVPRDYLAWMIDKGNFPRDTCNVIVEFLRGNYPRKTA